MGLAGFVIRCMPAWPIESLRLWIKTAVGDTGASRQWDMRDVRDRLAMGGDALLAAPVQPRHFCENSTTVSTSALDPTKNLPSWRVLLQRFRGRLRYGLLTLYFLHRLARAGLVVYPYFVSMERCRSEAPPATDPRSTVRALTAQDAAEMARISVGQSKEEAIVSGLSQPVCLGIFYDGQLAGYSWASLRTVPIPGSFGQSIFNLKPREAHLFYIYVAPRYRGLRLAGLLHRSLQHELARRGYRRFYSITLAFNRSSRRFNARLGVRELELRLYLHLHLRSLPGVDLRLWRREPSLRSPRWIRVLPVARAKSSA